MSILQHPKFDEFSSAYEQREGLPKGLLRSLIHQESRGNAAAVSPVGARGVAQFMPATAKAYNVDVDDPWDSLRGAAEYLGDSLRKYGTIEAALAEYNGGPRQATRVAAGQEPAARETQKYIPEVLGRLSKSQEQAITRSIAQGEGEDTQLAVLRRTRQYDDVIDDALSKGYKPDEIVAYIAGEAAKVGKDAYAASQAKGALGRAADQFATGLGNIGRSVSRVGSMVTGDEEGLQRKLQEQESIDGDLGNIADRASAAGAIGGFIGDNAAALVPVPGLQGAGLVTRLAAQGAGSGALQGLTTSRAEDLSGVAGDAGTAALVGTLGGGAAGATVKGLGRAKQFAQQVRTQPERLGVVEAQEVARISQEAGKRVGVDTLALDTEYIAKAQPILGKRLEDNMDGVGIRLDMEEAGDLFTASSNKRLPAMYREEAQKLVFSSVRDGKPVLRSAPVTVKELDNLRRAIGKDLSSPSLNAFEREALSKLEGSLSSTMEKAFAANPQKQAQFIQAKKQYDNFRVVRDLVAGTNGDAAQVLDPRKWASAQKRGSNRSRFVKGEAPMQDMTELLQQAKSQERMSYGPLGRAANSALNVADVMPIAGPLGRILGFRDVVQRLGDPKVRAAFEQLNPVEQAKILQQARA